ncbi:hypothetical protein CEXT_438011 [Caerostris extrusa]|uniref:Uncharacterized protein n=1 Tax=Caerostris extrusa TaxID=172846 RepID=A0AAV4TJW5_CAEEX|nr:hypothetical protein CEXT_438011 [Caerostris extrusa]
MRKRVISTVATVKKKSSDVSSNCKGVRCSNMNSTTQIYSKWAWVTVVQWSALLQYKELKPRDRRVLQNGREKHKPQIDTNCHGIKWAGLILIGRTDIHIFTSEIVVSEIYRVRDDDEHHHDVLVVCGHDICWSEDDV